MMTASVVLGAVWAQLGFDSSGSAANWSRWSMARDAGLDSRSLSRERCAAREACGVDDCNSWVSQLPKMFAGLGGKGIEHTELWFLWKSEIKYKHKEFNLRC